MHPSDDYPTDTAISLMLDQDNKIAWEHIYNKYASIMYGIIQNLTSNKEISEEIMIEVFVNLKRNKLLQGVETTLCRTLVIQTYHITTKYLKAIGQTVTIPRFSNLVY